jgi:hypothetical protein
MSRPGVAESQLRLCCWKSLTGAECRTSARTLLIERVEEGGSPEDDKEDDGEENLWKGTT